MDGALLCNLDQLIALCFVQRPDQFDVSATRGRHIAFGEGIHSCLGSPLARLEAKVVLEQVLAKLPDYRLSGSPARVPLASYSFQAEPER